MKRPESESYLVCKMLIINAKDIMAGFMLCFVRIGIVVPGAGCVVPRGIGLDAIWTPAETAMFEVT